MVQWNVLLIAFLALFVASMLVRMGLRFLNRQHLTRYGHVVPDVFKGEIEPDTLKRIRDYTVAVSNLGSIEILVDDLADLVIILSRIPALLCRHAPSVWPESGNSRDRVHVRLLVPARGDRGPL